MDPNTAPSFSLRHVLVLLQVISVIWFLGRTLGTYGMGETGTYVTVGVGLAFLALVFQVMTKAPGVLGNYETVSIFVLALAAASGLVYYPHYKVYGFSL